MTRWSVCLSSALLTCVLITACGGDDTPGDAGADASTDTGGELGPTPPMAPRLEPCPDGWRPVVGDDGVTTCDPYPESGIADCGRGEAHFVGEPGCAPVGDPCPAGDFADDLPADGTVVYVRAGSGPGDGSVGNPHGTIAEANPAGLSPGTVLALAKGSYDADVRLPSGVTLFGACAAETRISSSPSEGAAVINVIGSDVVVKNLSVVDSDRLGIWVYLAAASATLEGVAIENVRYMGLLANESTVTADGLVVRGTRPRLSDDLVGRGIAIEAGAQATLRRAVIEDSYDYGIRVGDAGSRLVAEDLTVRRTRSRATDLDFGRGLAIEFGASAEVDRVYIDENRDVGFFVLESDATARDLVVRRTTGQEGDASGGRGMSIQTANVQLERALVEDNREIGVFVETVSTSFSATDLVVRGTRFDAADDSAGYGILTQRGVTASLERVMVSDNQKVGVLVWDTSTLNAVDLSVVSTIGAEMDGTFGRGLVVTADSNAEVSRVLIADNRELGLSAALGGRLVASEVVVRDTRERDCTVDGRCDFAGFGIGVASHSSGDITLASFAVARSALCGVQLSDESSVDLSEGLITENDIGACVQVDGYDLGRLQDRVIYRDNGTSLDTTMLPVPDIATGVDP